MEKAIALALAAVMTCGLAACGKDKPQNDSIPQEDEHEPLTVMRFNDLITEEFMDVLHEVNPEINLQVVSYGGEMAPDWHNTA